MTPQKELPMNSTAEMVSSPTNNVPPFTKCQKFQTWEINLIIQYQKILRPIVVVVRNRHNILKTRKGIISFNMLIVWFKTTHLSKI